MNLEVKILQLRQLNLVMVTLSGLPKERLHLPLISKTVLSYILIKMSISKTIYFMKAKLSQIRLHSRCLLFLGSNISVLALYSETLNQLSFLGRPRYKWKGNIKGVSKEYRILANWMELVEKLDLPGTFFRNHY
jgi:hypothetical protein